jgi:hypothetical protein
MDTTDEQLEETFVAMLVQLALIKSVTDSPPAPTAPLGAAPFAFQACGF